MSYHSGNGVPQDYAESVRWFQKAADQGDAITQLYLGIIYKTGDTVPQDYPEAVKWFRKAADQGYGKAQYNLGEIYSEDEHIPHDYAEAYMWFNIAASNGHEEAKSDRDVLSDIMSPEQITEGQSMTRKWLEDFEKRTASKD